MKLIALCIDFHTCQMSNNAVNDFSLWINFHISGISNATVYDI